MCFANVFSKQGAQYFPLCAATTTSPAQPTRPRPATRGSAVVRTVSRVACLTTHREQSAIARFRFKNERQGKDDSIDTPVLRNRTHSTSGPRGKIWTCEPGRVKHTRRSRRTPIAMNSTDRVAPLTGIGVAPYQQQHTLTSRVKCQPAISAGQNADHSEC
jgi:hypothetical protein